MAKAARNRTQARPAPAVAPRIRAISIGFDVPGLARSYNIRSNASILDADVIIFSPNFGGYHGGDQYAGRLLLYQADSAALRDDAVHWRSELKTALEHGKTVFLYLVKPEEIYYYTGQRGPSGSGRSTRVTDYVSPFKSYNFIPVELQVIPRAGERIRIAGDLKVLATYWKDFGEYSPFEAYLDSPIGRVLLTTETGNKPVAAILNVGKGHLVILPPVDFDLIPTKLQTALGKKLVADLSGIDKALKRSVDATPPPAWAQDAQYGSSREAQLAQEIAELRTEIQERAAAIEN